MTGPAAPHSSADSSLPKEKSLGQFFKDLLNLKAETDFQGTREFIVDNVDFRSENAWTLAFAIFIIFLSKIGRRKNLLWEWIFCRRNLHLIIFKKI